MRRLILLALSFCAVAGPASAETRLLSYEPADRLTQALTRAITLEVDRGLFGAVAVRRLISSSARGSAEVERGGPEAVRAALPAGSDQTAAYSISPEGDGRPLTRALCPGADAAWLVLPRVRLGRPLEVQAVGRWADGTYRHCATLSYLWRGEWAGGLPSTGPAAD